MNLNQTLTAFRICVELLATHLAFGLSNYIIFSHFWVDGWSYPSLFLVVNLVTILSYYFTGQKYLNPSFKKIDFLKTISLGVVFIFVLVSIYWLIVYDHKYYLVHLILFLLFTFIFHYTLKYLWMMVMMRIMPRMFAMKNILCILPEIHPLIHIIQKNAWMKFNIVSRIEETDMSDLSLYINQFDLDFIICEEAFYNNNQDSIRKNQMVKWLFVSKSKPRFLTLDRVVENIKLYRSES